MQVQVQLFSILRDCIPPDAGGPGPGQATVSLPDGASLADLITRLGIDRRLGYPPGEVVSRAGWQVIVSGKYEPDMNRTLEEGDEIRVFPPVAGG
jgi:molybdopterin converting factor small subunit